MSAYHKRKDEESGSGGAQIGKLFWAEEIKKEDISWRKEFAGCLRIGFTM